MMMKIKHRLCIIFITFISSTAHASDRDFINKNFFYDSVLKPKFDYIDNPRDRELLSKNGWNENEDACEWKGIGIMCLVKNGQVIQIEWPPAGPMAGNITRVKTFKLQHQGSTYAQNKNFSLDDLSSVMNPDIVWIIPTNTKMKSARTLTEAINSGDEIGPSTVLVYKAFRPSQYLIGVRFSNAAKRKRPDVWQTKDETDGAFKAEYRVTDHSVGWASFGREELLEFNVTIYSHVTKSTTRSYYRYYEGLGGVTLTEIRAECVSSCDKLVQHAVDGVAKSFNEQKNSMMPVSITKTQPQPTASPRQPNSFVKTGPNGRQIGEFSAGGIGGEYIGELDADGWPLGFGTFESRFGVKYVGTWVRNVGKVTMISGTSKETGTYEFFKGFTPDKKITTSESQSKSQPSDSSKTQPKLQNHAQPQQQPGDDRRILQNRLDTLNFKYFQMLGVAIFLLQDNVLNDNVQKLLRNHIQIQDKDIQGKFKNDVKSGYDEIQQQMIELKNRNQLTHSNMELVVNKLLLADFDKINNLRNQVIADLKQYN